MKIWTKLLIVGAAQAELDLAAIQKHQETHSHYGHTHHGHHDHTHSGHDHDNYGWHDHNAGGDDHGHHHWHDADDDGQRDCLFEPGNVENGYYNCARAYGDFITTCTLYCVDGVTDAGYTFEPLKAEAALLTCNSNDKWKDADGKVRDPTWCVPAASLCPTSKDDIEALYPPGPGSWQITKHGGMTDIRLVCNNGKRPEISDHETSRCINGNWSPMPTKCIDDIDHCAAGHPHDTNKNTIHGNWVCTRTLASGTSVVLQHNRHQVEPGWSCTLNCDLGFQAEDGWVADCSDIEGGSWEPSTLPVCTPIKDCTMPVDDACTNWDCQTAWQTYDDTYNHHATPDHHHHGSDHHHHGRKRRDGWHGSLHPDFWGEKNYLKKVTTCVGVCGNKCKTEGSSNTHHCYHDTGLWDWDPTKCFPDVHNHYVNEMSDHPCNKIQDGFKVAAPATWKGDPYDSSDNWNNHGEYSCTDFVEVTIGYPHIADNDANYSGRRRRDDDPEAEPEPEPEPEGGERHGDMYGHGHGSHHGHSHGHTYDHDHSHHHTGGSHGHTHESHHGHSHGHTYDHTHDHHHAAGAGHNVGHGHDHGHGTGHGHGHTHLPSGAEVEQKTCTLTCSGSKVPASGSWSTVCQKGFGTETWLSPITVCVNEDDKSALPGGGRGSGGKESGKESKKNKKDKGAKKAAKKKKKYDKEAKKANKKNKKDKKKKKKDNKRSLRGN